MSARDELAMDDAAKSSVPTMTMDELQALLTEAANDEAKHAPIEATPKPPPQIPRDAGAQQVFRGVLMQAARFDAAIAHCLQYAASSSDPAAAAATFLRRLLDDPDWTVDEIEKVTDSVVRIIQGSMYRQSGNS